MCHAEGISLLLKSNYVTYPYNYNINALIFLAFCLVTLLEFVGVGFVSQNLSSLCCFVSNNTCIRGHKKYHCWAKLLSPINLSLIRPPLLGEGFCISHRYVCHAPIGSVGHFYSLKLDSLTHTGSCQNFWQN